MSARFDEHDHPRGDDGKFAAKTVAEADVSLLTREPFDLYADVEARPVGPYANTPVWKVSTVQPGQSVHVGLGTGRGWATVCDQDNPRTGLACEALLFADDPGALRSAISRHEFVEHRTEGMQRADGSRYEIVDEVPLADDEWVVDERHGIRVCFTNIDEGWNGEYDPDDPTDDNLLRIDVQVRPEHPDADENEDADDQTGPWRWPVGTGSWCTQIRADHVTPEQKRRIIRTAVEDLAETTRGGSSIRGVVDSFQGWDESDDRCGRYEGDSPTEFEKQQAAKA